MVELFGSLNSHVNDGDWEEYYSPFYDLLKFVGWNNTADLRKLLVEKGYVRDESTISNARANISFVQHKYTMLVPRFPRSSQLNYLKSAEWWLHMQDYLLNTIFPGSFNEFDALANTYLPVKMLSGTNITKSLYNSWEYIPGITGIDGYESRSEGSKSSFVCVGLA